VRITRSACGAGMGSRSSRERSLPAHRVGHAEGRPRIPARPDPGPHCQDQGSAGRSDRRQADERARADLDPDRHPAA
jgi:hypothetical protein